MPDGQPPAWPQPQAGTLAAGAPADPLALYIHWPFCLAKCPYCDFNSHVRDRIPQARFARALRTELAWEAARLGRRPLASIFFGGGTPSLMVPQTVADLIADATALFDPLPGLEVTLEANPTSTELAKLRGFRDAGVNRASLGIQSLDAGALAMLGRQHSAGEAVAALEAARSTFPRVSFDLIYARPGQGVAAWQAELRQALALCADHLSLYQLTVEPGTGFEALHRRGELVLPDGDLAAQVAQLTAERDDMRDRWMRAEAEMANIRARAKRDVDDTRQYAVQKFAADVVEAAENLRRGLNTLPPHQDGEPDIVTKLRDGLDGVERSFVAILERNGIKRTDPTGQPFDANLHQAMAEQPSDGHAPGTVLQAWTQAWTLNGRLLRPAMVVVAKAAAAPAQAADGAAHGTAPTLDGHSQEDSAA